MNKAIICILLSLLCIQTVQGSNCWKTAYGRGVGQPISSCNDGDEKDGLLCYPVCRNGFSGVGPVCWQNCPEGFPDTGADCLKPSSYGRGAGYVSMSICLSHFPACE